MSNISASSTFPDNNEPFITSWSGGKDACFAFWLAVQTGAKPVAIFTMLDETGEQTSSHGLPKNIIQAQADALGVPAMFRAVPRGHYERYLKEVVLESQQQYQATSVVFGDIDLDVHKEWLDRVTDEARITPRFPLWHYPRRPLLDDVLDAGFKTMIVSVKHDQMDPSYLGKIMTPTLADEIQALGICPTAEDGEFHSLVMDGPGFSQPVPVKTSGTRQDDRGHTILNISLNNSLDEQAQ